MNKQSNNRNFLAMLLSIVGCLCFSSWSLAASVLDNHIYDLTLPEGWTVEKEGMPVEIRGPNSEAMFVTGVIPHPDSNIEEDSAGAMVEMMREGVTLALQGGAAQEGLETITPIESIQLGGVEVLRTLSRNKENKSFLAQYGVLGKSGAVILLTVEGWRTSESSAVRLTEKMLNKIKWK